MILLVLVPRAGTTKVHAATVGAWLSHVLRPLVRRPDAAQASFEYGTNHKEIIDIARRSVCQLRCCLSTPLFVEERHLFHVFVQSRSVHVFSHDI